MFKNIIAVALITLFAFSCKNEAKPEVKTMDVGTNTETTKLDPNTTYAKAEFTIDGMTCAIGCAATIQKKISKMDGVKSATVDFDRKLAMVEYNEAKVTPALLEETVTKVSDVYKVSDMKTVKDFSTKTACAADCKKACCANKKGKSCSGEKACKVKCSADCKDKDCTKCAALKAECKKKCDAKKAEASGDKKTACAADCKKACCAEKKDA